MGILATISFLGALLVSLVTTRRWSDLLPIGLALLGIGLLMEAVMVVDTRASVTYCWTAIAARMPEDRPTCVCRGYERTT